MDRKSRDLRRRLERLQRAMWHVAEELEAARGVPDEERVWDWGAALRVQACTIEGWRMELKGSKMKLYLAGPVTGMPNENREAFAMAQKVLDEAGYEVVNPHELRLDPGLTWAQCMKPCLLAMLNCDALAMLEGWERSPGARLEQRVARELSMPVFKVGAWLGEGLTECAS